MLRRESSTLINTEHKSTRLRKGAYGRAAETADGENGKRTARRRNGGVEREWVPTALLDVTISVAIVGNGNWLPWWTGEDRARGTRDI